MDTGIALGSEKILALLAIRADHHSRTGRAPKLRDAHCIAFGVSPTWTGEAVADFPQKAIHAVGRPAAFLKDGGTDLAKAARLLKERGKDIPCVDDIST